MGSINDNIGNIQGTCFKDIMSERANRTGAECTDMRCFEEISPACEEDVLDVV